LECIYAIFVPLSHFNLSLSISRHLLINLQIPHSLYKDEGYAHREALFGYPPYGGSIAQQVYYADSQLCDVEVDTTKGYPEREKENGVMKPWPSPYILMVDRGECTFVQKVRALLIYLYITLGWVGFL
jgi:hypothetical protein